MHDRDVAYRLATVTSEISELRDAHDRLVSERDALINELRVTHGWTLERIATCTDITAQAIHKRLKKENTHND